MHVGADIREGLSEAHAQNKYKTNIFGRGYEGGNKATVGCSAKGRVWSHRVASDIGEWVSWCREIGKKLQNAEIDVRDILKCAMVPEPVKDRPAKVPLTIEWSDDLLDRSEEAVKFELAGVPVPFYEVGMELTDHLDSGPIRFRVCSDSWPAESVEYEVKFGADRVDYAPLSSVKVSVTLGRRKRPLSKYLQAEPPLIRFHDGSLLIYANLYAPPGMRPAAYDRNRIEVWDWTGVDLKQESQKQVKRPKSIQRRVITTLMATTGKDRFHVIFDDDESGESADVVAIRIDKDRLLFRLYHCKFAKDGTVIARVDDLYAVCGQAQSSVHWKGRIESLLDHLIRREGKRMAKGGESRFEQGDLKTLKLIKRKLRSLRPEFESFIVQPGLSQAKAGNDHLELLAVTELHLRETYNIPFTMVASA